MWTSPRHTPFLSTYLLCTSTMVVSEQMTALEEFSQATARASLLKVIYQNARVISQQNNAPETCYCGKADFDFVG